MKPPQVIQATQAELDELLALAKQSFPAAQYELLEGVLATFTYLMEALQNARSSIKRLRQMLFGASTESKRKVLAELTDPDDCVDVGTTRARAEDPAGRTSTTKRGAKKPRVGHGRNGARDYEGAAVVELNELGVKAGALCPSCQTGRVYPFAPRVLVKITGQPPLAATVYKVARLRCRLCDAVITAAMPPGLEQQPKYDEGCASMLAVLRYGYGMPFFRLEALQRSLGVPLSDATQWDIVSNAVAAPKAVFEELIRQAAQAPLLHSDDTRMKVLELMAERARAEREGRKPEAKAINTSAIVAVLEQQRQVVLYFTGHAHAGNNMQRVLEQRPQTLSAPLHMCDALAANVAGGFDTLGANCLTHGRRQVVEIAQHFPAAARRVIEDLASVYEHDATCREQAMTPQQRLAFHQEHSGPILQALHGWIDEQFEQRLVEPNSGLGKALKYLLRHWKKLTLFLRVAGAPLDNNLCEQVLKRAILHRKASMFYKTLQGALVGDIYMSLIQTCGLCGVNPLEYLKALMRHASQVVAQAAQWLPWNFHEQLAPSG